MCRGQAQALSAQRRALHVPSSAGHGLAAIYLRITIERPRLLCPWNHVSIVRGIPARAGVNTAP
jgi:hypothetical protein